MRGDGAGLLTFYWAEQSQLLCLLPDISIVLIHGTPSCSLLDMWGREPIRCRPSRLMDCRGVVQLASVLNVGSDMEAYRCGVGVLT